MIWLHFGTKEETILFRKFHGDTHQQKLGNLIFGKLKRAKLEIAGFKLMYLISDDGNTKATHY